MNCVNDIAISTSDLSRLFADFLDEEIAQITAVRMIALTQNTFPLPSLDLLTSQDEKSQDAHYFLKDLAEKIRDSLTIEVPPVAEKKKADIAHLSKYLDQLHSGLLPGDVLTSLRNDASIQKDFTERGRIRKLAAENDYKNCVDFIQSMIECKTNEINKLIPSTIDNILRSKTDEMVEISFSLYSDLCQNELESKEEGPVHMIHFYEFMPSKEDCIRGNPRKSEFLTAYDSDSESNESIPSFEQTSHGLGSAVYGVAKLDQELMSELISQLKSKKSRFKTILITHPLRISNEDSDLMTELSKSMQRVVENAKNIQLGLRKSSSPLRGKISRKKALELALALDEDILTGMADGFCRMSCFKHYTRKKACEFIYDALEKFIKSAKSSHSETTPMPINYLITNLGYNGIVSHYNNLFNRGLVAFDPEGTENWNKAPAKGTFLRKNSSSLLFGSGIASDRSRFPSPLTSSLEDSNDATSVTPRSSFSS